MTYVNKKTRLFLDRGDVKPERRRSEARLKTYPSSIDMRAWCDIVEDRRQHILELVYKGTQKCMGGQLIPVETIVNALVALRLADCEKLKKCMAQMWQFILGLNLNDEDRQKLYAMRKAMASICIGKKEDEQLAGAKARLRRLESEDECVAKARHEKELQEINELLNGDEQGGTYKVTTKGPARITTRIKGFRQGLQGIPAGSITTRAQGPSRVKTLQQSFSSPNSKPSNGNDPVNAKGSSSRPESSRSKRSEDQTGSTARDREARGINDSRPTTPSHQNWKSLGADTTEQPTYESISQSPSRRSKSMERSSRRKSQERENTLEPLAEFAPLYNSSMIAEDGKNVPGPRKQLQAPNLNNIDDVKIQLEARETLCNELQTTLGTIKNERDEFKKKFEATLEELENVKKLNAASTVIPTSCKEEIEALELEIKVMRSGNLSPEQEAEVIRKEVEVLRKYCLKLKSVEDENEKLRLERDTLKSQANLSDDPRGERPKSAKETLNRQVAGIVGDSNKATNDDGIYETSPDTEKDIDSNSLEAITRERDMLANKVQRLEKELLQYRDLPEDLEVYRNRSKMLDSALEERDKMSKKIEQMKSIEDELNQLRKKSSRVDELEEELKSFTKNDKNVGSELKKTKSKCVCLERELQNVKMERDSMRTRIEYMKKEIEMLRGKSKEAEIYQLERDKLQIKVNELSHVQMQYENLLLKCKCLENAAAEKEMYKQKYEEVVSMECQGDMLRNQMETAKCLEREKTALVKQVGDLESCICDQEDEIKKLVLQIDTLCRNKDDNQCRMREALACMRAEIEKKDFLIEESEQKLAAVQAQLKSSIQGVSCETTCYRTRIEELERELCKAQTQIGTLQKQLDEKCTSLKGLDKLTKLECEAVCAMKKEVNIAKDENEKLRKIATKMAALTGDEHVKNMLKQSQCAVKRVVEELGRQYKEWDNLKRNHKKGVYVQGKECPCKRCHRESSGVSDSENEKLLEELEDIQREKAKLEQLVKQINEDKMSSDGPQKELISLRIDNTKLQEQLEKEMRRRKDLEKKLKS